MANKEVGSAYVSIIPTVKGFEGKVTEGIKKGIGSITKVAAAGFTAISGAVTATGTAAVKSWSEYEQLAGGMETLFKNTQTGADASREVFMNAGDAYKTLGISMNDYMSQASGFAAALKQSLGGDVKAAAASTNVAITDMADNVSVFGSNLEDVQNAYQGFAKQNYTMLDNLKLGYGGTKSEMERLIKDANEWGAANGQASDLSIDKFSDVVQAIHQIQEKQGLAGNAAREASETVAGSFGVLKAAWENFLIDLGNGENIEESMQAVIDSAKIFLGNLMPIVENVISSVAAAVPQLFNAIDPSAAVDMVMRIAQAAIPSAQAAAGLVLDVVVSTFNTLASMAGLNLPKLDSSGIKAGVQEAIDWVTGAASNFVDGFKRGLDNAGITDALGKLNEAFTHLKSALEPAATFVRDTLAPALGDITATAITDGIKVVAGAIDGLSGKPLGAIAAGLLGVAAAIKAIEMAKAAGAAIQGVAGAFTMLTNPVTLVIGVIGAVVGVIVYLWTTNEGFRNAIITAWEAIKGFFAGLPGFFSGLFQGIGAFVGGVWNGITQGVQNVYNGVVQWISGIPGYFKAQFELAKANVQFAINLVRGIIQAIPGFVAQFLSGIAGKFLNAFNAAKQNVSNAVSGIKSFVGGIPGAVAGFVSSIPGKFANAFNNAKSRAKSAIDGVANGVRDLPGKIGNFISSIPGKFASMFSRIHVPSLHIEGGFNLDPLNFKLPKIRFYGTGGMITSPTLAVRGERGAEFEWPSYEPYMSMYAAAIAEHLPEARAERETGSATIAAAEMILEALPKIIADNAPAATPREFRRMVVASL